MSLDSESITEPDFMRLVAAGKVNVDSKYNGSPALMIAIENRNRNLINKSLDAGANPNAKNTNLETLLMIAGVVNDSETTRKLLGHGANPFETDGMGLTAAGWVGSVNGPTPTLEILRTAMDSLKSLNAPEAELVSETRKAAIVPDPPPLNRTAAAKVAD